MMPPMSPTGLGQMRSVLKPVMH